MTVDQLTSGQTTVCLIGSWIICRRMHDGASG